MAQRPDVRVLLILQGISNIAVQSSVSLQHLPVDKRIEKDLPSQLLNRLSFATQKLVRLPACRPTTPWYMQTCSSDSVLFHFGILSQAITN